MTIPFFPSFSVLVTSNFHPLFCPILPSFFLTSILLNPFYNTFFLSHSTSMFLSPYPIKSLSPFSSFSIITSPQIIPLYHSSNFCFFIHRYYAAPTMHHAILLEAEQRSFTTKDDGIDAWNSKYVTSSLLVPFDLIFSFLFLCIFSSFLLSTLFSSLL